MSSTRHESTRIMQAAYIPFRARQIDMELQTRYVYNSLSLSSPEMDPVLAAAKEHQIAVVLGFAERTPTNSTYIAQAIISPQGEVVVKRRKIKPTHMERTLFGDGSGDDLTTTAELDFGAPLGKIKVSTMSCWEHTQPLLKYHTISQGPVIHVSMWPPVDPTTGPEHPGLWSMTKEGCQNLSQTFAIESAAFVLHTTAVCSNKGIEAMKTQAGLACREPGGGHSCVIGPDGRVITDPLGHGNADAEGILYVDLDLSKVVATKGWLDNVGHYSRPDLLWLGVDKKQKQHVVGKSSG